MVDHMKSLNGPISIAVVGKYAEYPDSYISVREALRHAGLAHNKEVKIDWVHSEDVERLGPESLLANACGIVVPVGLVPEELRVWLIPLLMRDNIRSHFWGFPWVCKL